VAVSLDQPVLVVGCPEVDQGLAELFDGVEGSHPQQVLLEGPDEPLGASVALGRPDEGRRGRDAQPSDLALEVVGHVLGPVIVPQAQPCGDVLADSAKTSRHTELR
jgi:hypothetical protein